MRPLTARSPRVACARVFPLRERARRTVSKGSSSRRRRRSRGTMAGRAARLRDTKTRQGYPLVGEAIGIHPHPISNEVGYRGELARGLRVFGIAAAVQADGGADEPVLQVEAEEGASPRIAAEDEVVPAGSEAHVLDQVLVLIRPEGVEIVVGLGTPQHGVRCRAPLPVAVVPVLDPHPPEE